MPDDGNTLVHRGGASSTKKDQATEQQQQQSQSQSSQHTDKDSNNNTHDEQEEEELKNAPKEFHSRITSAKTGWKSMTPFRQIIFLAKLFFSRQFFSHRIIGLFYLIQYFLAMYLYFFNYNVFRTSILIWMLPLTGVTQSVNAALTFTFLPKKKEDGGYFGDKSIMSYPF
ncbi:hypothetical protein HDU76_000912, partial [Blyttiomyces sp. JEL0837]